MLFVVLATPRQGGANVEAGDGCELGHKRGRNAPGEAAGRALPQVEYQLK